MNGLASGEKHLFGDKLARGTTWHGRRPITLVSRPDDERFHEDAAMCQHGVVGLAWLTRFHKPEIHQRRLGKVDRDLGSLNFRVTPLTDKTQKVAGSGYGSA